MWPGPYGEWGSRKYLLASLDQSLGRMGLDYVDIFYSHRLRPGHAAGGDARRARHGGAPGQGAVRRDLVVLGGAHAGGGGDPARARHAAADPPAVLLAAEPLDRGRLLDVLGREGRRLHRLLAARAGHAHRPLPRRHPRGLARRAGQVAGPRLPHGGEPRSDPGAERDRRSAAGSRSPRWRSPGCCATRGSPPRWSARAASRQLEDKVAALQRLDFSDDELAEIDRYAEEAGINLWARSSDA